MKKADKLKNIYTLVLLKKTSNKVLLLMKELTKTSQINIENIKKLEESKVNFRNIGFKKTRKNKEKKEKKVLKKITIIFINAKFRKGTKIYIHILVYIYILHSRLKADDFI